MCKPTQGVWQPAGCVSCELVCVCVSIVRVVIICPASTHTALVSSPSLAVLHLSTYLPTAHWHDKGADWRGLAHTQAHHRSRLSDSVMKKNARAAAAGVRRVCGMSVGPRAICHVRLAFVS